MIQRFVCSSSPVEARNLLWCSKDHGSNPSINIKVILDVQSNILLQRYLLLLFASLQLKIMKHLLKSLRINTTSYTIASVFLFLLRNDIKVSFECVHNEPDNINQRIQEQDQWTEDNEDYCATEPIGRCAGACALWILDHQCELVANDLDVGEGKDDKLVNDEDTEVDQEDG